MAALFPGRNEGDGSFNEFFKKLSLADFPKPTLGRILQLPSDLSVTNACRTLSAQNILSAPVLDVEKEEFESWVDKYVGIVDFLSIVDWMVRETHHHKPKDLQELMSLKESFNTATIAELANSARWTKFIPLDSKTSTTLDALLLLGKYGQHRVCIVDSPGGDLVNMITQSAMLEQLAHCNPMFESLTSKTLKQLGWSEHPDGKALISINIEKTYWDAFGLISDNLVSGLPVVDADGKLVGAVSVRDIRTMVNDPSQFFKLNSTLDIGPPHHLQLHACREKDTLQSIMDKMCKTRAHRLYLVDEQHKPVAVISLGDVLAKFVKEPEDSTLSEYFINKVSLSAL